MSIFLDYAATTPLDKKVLKAMLPFLEGNFANASSLHSSGRKARKAVEDAREQVAQAIGSSEKEIIFTSGATEAINQAIRMSVVGKSGKKIISSGLEHSATISSLKLLEARGYEIVLLKPEQNGNINPSSVEKLIDENTALVSLMLVNNETGIKTDISTISGLAHEQGALVFCDAVQAFGLEQIDVKDLAVDMLTISAHKFYGPKGVAALFIKEGTEIESLVVGGAQERGFRAGTLNTAAIVGMAAAGQIAVNNIEESFGHLRKLQKHFEEIVLATIEEISVNGAKANRGPKHSNILVNNADGEALLFNLDLLGIEASAGSACSSGSLEASHVLTNMGLSKADARSSIRFSFGKQLSLEDIDKSAALFKAAVERSRQFS